MTTAPSEHPTAPTQTELEHRLAGQRMALGKAKKTQGECIAMGKDPADASAALANAERRIAELLAGIDAFKQKALDDQEAARRQSKLVDAQIEFEVLTHHAEQGAKVQAWMDQGRKLMQEGYIPAYNAARSLPNDSLRVQLMQAALWFLPSLMAAVEGMPNVKRPLITRKEPWAALLPTPTPRAEKP